MTKRNLDAALISSVPNITYLTGFSHFSKDEREAFLFITKAKQYILTDGRYSEAVVNKINDFELIEISTKLSLEKALKLLVEKHDAKKVGIDHYSITLAEHKKLSSCFKALKHFSIESLRIIKDSSEITAIEKACRLGDKTFKRILGKVKEGITEKELAFEIEFFIKKSGADISFPPIVAFGKNSSIPHHKSADKKLEKNSIVLLDFGVRLNNYCSDMTRTVFFGSANAKFKKMYQTVLDAQQKAIKALTSDGGPERSRMDSSEVDRVARSYITSKGFPSIPHSLGHGIGLDVHESPRLSPKSKDILKPGMVFSIEPGIYLPGYGGVRIEDVVAIEKSGPRALTKSPKELIEVK